MIFLFKIFDMRRTLFVLLAGIIFSCTEQKQEDPVLTAYYKVKDALVETNSADAALYAQELSTLTSNDPIWSDVTLHAGEMAVSQDDVEKQREAFERLSNALYDAFQAANPNGATIYVQYCPMAFNDKGAYWLSSEEEIFNPYFGDKMLHCGVVKETIEL